MWVEVNGHWKVEAVLSQHDDWVRDVAWAPNLGLPKSTIASAGQDGKVIYAACISGRNSFDARSAVAQVVIWTKAAGKWTPCTLHTWPVPVWRVSWSLTGSILAVSDGNNNVSLWKESLDGQWQQVTG